MHRLHFISDEKINIGAATPMPDSARLPNLHLRNLKSNEKQTSMSCTLLFEAENSVIRKGARKMTNAQSRIVQKGMFTNKVYEILIHQCISKKVLV